MAFKENTRVKIPLILRLCRLGFQYISLSKAKWDLNRSGNEYGGRAGR